ncbi:hypothetical protein HMPREF3120_00445 [Corynebacterium sp. HMSC11D10]|nr:hypothetical protein HMPREF3120_00445 [Corynebacterium sp. HMSC11D10]
MFLLEKIGLSGKLIRKNKHGATHSLSFRDLLRVCLVTETAMQSKLRPGTTKNPGTQTKELSVIRLLLTGEDDSDLTETETPHERRRTRRAQLEVLEKLRSQLEAQVELNDEPSELEDQIRRLDARTRDIASAVGSLVAQREEKLVARMAIERSIGELQSNYLEVKPLLERFRLLLQQYDSDLERLRAIREAGNPLGLFQQGTCVFCGAAPSDQHLEIECDGDSTGFEQSVLGELTRTQRLRDDLLPTIRNLKRQVEHLDAQIQALTEQYSQMGEAIKLFDNELAPSRSNLDKILQERAEYERRLGSAKQLQNVEELIQQVANEPSNRDVDQQPSLDSFIARSYSKSLSNCLKRWGFPNAESVRYEPDSMDIYADGQSRAAHGKGVRAILHAAFTLTLAQYCFDQSLPHPGFVILDSPILAYRPPDTTNRDAKEPPSEMIDGFYHDIQTSFGCQIIVLENISPISPLNDASRSIRFTKNPSMGRYGLFSANQDD